MFEVGAVKWSGAGCLVGPLLLLGLAVGVVFQGLFDGKTLVTDIAWVAGFVLSAILIRVIGRRLNRYGTVHTLYDSPMEGYAWLAIACAALTLGLVLLIRLVAV
ncbi:hypothetical protein [Amycolatopsis regifaucium]|uniref:DUF3017 domain-containing protein n=1 Tax=Amycolatopsis regifaucium TaxID=546365 RepID=A0A154MW02_9PSEU|nr:hypothetical protein [Amycolatopsis regifaucium]KZB87639.1 hypothetical protein AVL48_23820 [Amycolatopsis regifaucium]OKA05463.1 hypothetical protein ATP06_0225535 [Amycolatopsis regifaucium]SFI11581.1 hypothetical protein SAMN04489731_108239 [Amycolatopsis regifaucium]